ncbi:MAG: DUF1810 domain-containing protein [Caldilineaceae bacterium]
MSSTTHTDNTTDPFDLQRFVSAQAPTYATALTELRNGRKRSHWMWFIFPQIVGLGHSPTSQRYAIKSREEASHYLEHPLLGPRLRECAATLLAVDGHSAWEIFGSPDDLKLKSSMTLFAQVTPPDSVFAKVLAKYFTGQRDAKTLAILEQRKSHDKADGK